MIGKKAHPFSLKDQNEQVRTLEEFKGKYLLLYFYPKDATPGCTVEAQKFSHYLNDLADAGVQVVGVSADSCTSHKKFAEKFNLHFPLLADEEKELIQAYDLWVEKSMFGKKFYGIRRDSFLIDPEGTIIKQYEKVNPKKHAEEVLKDVKAL